MKHLNFLSQLSRLLGILSKEVLEAVPMKLFLSALIGFSAAVAMPTGPTAAQQNCDASYPTLCIPPGAPDLDCADVDQKNFPVRQPDPHRFDGDKDGVGCESRS